MDALQRLIDRTSHLSYDEKVVAGRRCVGNINYALSELGLDDDTRFAFILSVIGVAVSGDRTTSFQEYALCCGIFGELMAYEAFYDLTNGGASAEVVRKIDAIVDNFTSETKHDCCELALLFLSADGDVTHAEKDLFSRLLA